MYQSVKGSCSIKFDNKVLKPFFQRSKSLEEEDKIKIAREVISNEYQKYTHKVLGCYRGIKSISDVKLNCDTQGYENCILTANIEFYFYKLTTKDVIDFVIESITPNFVQGSVGGYIITVPVDHLSQNTPVYNAALNYFQIGDKKIKLMDTLRIRITSITNPIRVNCDSFKIVGSCRNTGAGKLVL